jgi:hypothetical protein
MPTLMVLPAQSIKPTILAASGATDSAQCAGKPTAALRH